MSTLASFGVRNHVVANLVMFAIIGAGLIFGVTLRKEFFPEVNPTLVRVTAPYPGAAPDEVEDGLAIKIEDALIDRVDDIKELNTTISEGFASMLIEFEEGVNIDRAVFDVKREMDALQDLPEQSELITVAVVEPNFPAIVISLFGSDNERALKDGIERVRDDLRLLDGMGEMVVSGVRVDEVAVEIDPDKLLEHNLSLPEVAGRVRAAMIDLPGGAVRSETVNTAIRMIGTEEEAELVRNIAVQAQGDGAVIRVRDIAQVTEGFADVDIRERLDGEPSVSITVYKEGKQDAVVMAELVKAYAAGMRGEEFQPTFIERMKMLGARGEDAPPVSERERAWRMGRMAPPTPGDVKTTTDLSRFIVGRLELLSRNALMGGALVLITLVVLLNFRVAFWVAAGLVVSLLGTLAAMAALGITLNLLTMFGLIIVVGILVDDAIVVAENIVARHEAGEDARLAAVRGTGQVHWPVVTTVLTTVWAFLPIALIGGQVGDLLGVLPWVVGISLAVSLIECLFILPSHMASSLRAADKAKEKTAKSFLGRFGDRVDVWRESFIQRGLVPMYMVVLRWSVSHRYVTLAAAIGAIVISMGMVGGKRVAFEFFPSSDSETMSIDVRLPVGSPAAETDKVIRRLEAFLGEPGAFPEISSMFAQVAMSSSLDGVNSTMQSHSGQAILELTPVEDRDNGQGRSSAQIKAAIEEFGETLPGLERFLVEEVTGGPQGAAITLTISGENPDVLESVAERLKDELAQYDGVRSIGDDNEAGRRELRFKLLDGAKELGFTEASVAEQVRGWVFGVEAHTFAGEREDVDVRVMLNQDARRSLAAIEQLHLFTPMGVPVPLQEVVAIEEARGYATVRRLDRERVLTVTADVDPAVTSAEQVMPSIRPVLAQIERETPGIRILERGRQEEMRDSFATLPIGMAVACGLIYVTLAWLFGSFFQPLAVLSAVPFAIVGMVWGHYFLGYSMTMLSLIGFVALSGIVVNDSLIFMEFYNHQRQAGKSVVDAVLAAGRARLRAILLTTVTTVLGLLPLMLEQSFQAKFLIPMAITIACGLISATVLVLIILPCILLVGRDLKMVFSYLWNGVWPEEPKVEVVHIPED